MRERIQAVDLSPFTVDELESFAAWFTRAAELAVERKYHEQVAALMLSARLACHEELTCRDAGLPPGWRCIVADVSLADDESLQRARAALSVSASPPPADAVKALIFAERQARVYAQAAQPVDALVC